MKGRVADEMNKVVSTLEGWPLRLSISVAYFYFVVVSFPAAK